MPYEVESDESIDEMFEAFDESSDESDEAARWRPRAKVASGKNLYSPRPQTQYVTQQQLQTALAKVGAQVRTNSTAITQIGARVAGMAATVKKETIDRKREIAGLRSSLSQTQQMSAILPLLTQPKSLPITGLAANGIPEGTNVEVASGSTLNLLMPMLLFSSMGDGSTNSSGTGMTGGLFGSGDNNMMSTFMLFAVLGGLGK